MSSRHGASATILNAVFARQLEMALSVPVKKMEANLMSKPSTVTFRVPRELTQVRALLRRESVQTNLPDWDDAAE